MATDPKSTRNEHAVAEAPIPPAIVTARLREMSRLLAERGFVSKGVDMSPAAISARLRSWSALTEMCRRLAVAGNRLPAG